MNKTVSCNISGIIFNLEEDAYAILSKYLTKLKTHLKHTDGGDEIYEDIELRIAELFSLKLNATKQVILESDTNEVIDILGKPEDYIEEEPENSTFDKDQAHTNTPHDEKKVFMRDPDNGMIGGVCSGVSAYFGIDLTVVRAIFVLLFFITGFGLGLYIILWIISPKAISSADKLRMRGKPINIDNIKKEVQDAAERVEKYATSKSTRQKYENVKQRTSQVGRTISSIIGLFFIIGAAAGVIVFLTITLTEIGIFSSEDGERLISLYDFSDVIFRSSLQSFIGWTGLLGTVLIPLIFILMIGITLLLHIKSQWVKYIYVSLLIGWFTSIGLLTIAGFQIGREFTHQAEIEDIVGTVDSNKLVIHVPDMMNLSSNVKISINNEEFSDMLSIENKHIKSGFVTLRFEPSKDSLFHIRSEKSSYGITTKKALMLNNNIQHEIQLDSNEVTILPYYLFPTEDKLRGQQVTVYIAVPEGGNIEWKGNKKQLNISKRSRKIQFEGKTIEISID